MYQCDVCGRSVNQKIRMNGHILCRKHQRQLKRHGRFMDNTPRNSHDLNDYRIQNDGVYFNLYNLQTEKTGEFVVDLQDIEKVKYHRWSLAHGHVVTGKTHRNISHILLDIPQDQDATVVDHKDGDPLNNRRENLRICTKGQNALNKSYNSTNTSGFIGVTYEKERGRYTPEIRAGHNRCHLGRYRTLQEAAYARGVAEEIVFGEFANEAEHLKKMECAQTLADSRKREIAEYVRNKLASKNNLGN